MATLHELTLEVMDRLNLSSPEAAARIVRELNTRYKRVTSSIGLVTSRRAPITQAATIGNRDVTFSAIEKIDNVYRKVGTKNILLDEITFEEMIDADIVTDPPTKYCIVNVLPTSVKIRLNSVPATGFNLYADGLASALNLAGDDSPAFPESYHDILVYGAMADEYKKMEKFDLAKDSEADFENRLSDLRMFIAKSAFLDIYQGKSQERYGWWDTQKNP